MFKKVTKKQRKSLYRIFACIPLFIAGLLLPSSGWLSLTVNVAAFCVIGSNVVWKALKNIRHGRVFDENFLMTIASIGAFFTGEYVESVAVMLFYQVGEWFQSYAVSRSRKSIADLMDIRPDYANIEKDGELIQIDPDEVKADDIIVVKAGEKVPLDGVVIFGNSLLDTAALTGESIPRKADVGDEVFSGVINQSGLIKLRVTKEFGESTVAKILDLVENASNKKSQSEHFISKFARYYTPAVVISALFLAFLPPLFLPGAAFSDWIHRALIFLVISCPCALVISVPLSFFGGIGGASKAGILIKGSNYLETLANTEIVVFDKTGTLTKGTFEVQTIHAVSYERDALLELTAYAESYSNHPISLSLRKAYGKVMDSSRVSSAEEISGLGIKAVVDGKTIHAGNQKLMDSIGLSVLDTLSEGTVVHIAIEGVYEGYILIADEIKKDAVSAISNLKKNGVNRIVMLTGDNQASAESVAKKLGLDEVHAELLPGGKVEKVELLLAQTSKKGKLAFTGDGINDAPVLSRADIGIAMGALGSDAAIEAADVVIMTDEPSAIADALAISKKTLRIVKQNIIFALGVKLLFLIMGAFGFATMWEAVFADVGVSVVAILNAMRALSYRK